MPRLPYFRSLFATVCAGVLHRPTRTPSVGLTQGGKLLPLSEKWACPWAVVISHAGQCATLGQVVFHVLLRALGLHPDGGRQHLA